MSEELTLPDCRRLAIEQLRRRIGDPRPFSVFQIVEQIMHERYMGEYQRSMPQNIQKMREEMLAEVIWDLVFERVLTPITDSSNANLQFHRITEYGKKVLGAGEIQPHDPYGYIEALKAIPSIDPIIMTYVEESLQAYLENLQLSAAVTLGAASERGINVLLNKLIATTTTPRLSTKFNRLQNKGIKAKHKGIADELNHVKGSPDFPEEHYDCFFQGIFDIYRINRNEAGHPTGNKVDKNAMFSYLTLFVPYCTLIYEIIDYVIAHPL